LLEVIVIFWGMADGSMVTAADVPESREIWTCVNAPAWIKGLRGVIVFFWKIADGAMAVKPDALEKRTNRDCVSAVTE
jgi:hypothetical protein